MKGFGTIAAVVIFVFLLGLGSPVLLVKLGALRPPQTVAVVAVTSTPAPAWTPRPIRKPEPTSIPVVTLQAAPGSNMVQMFHSLTSNSKITRLATGLRCTKMDGPVSIAESGVPMSFYWLDCMGTLGYVNTKWTR